MVIGILGVAMIVPMYAQDEVWDRFRGPNGAGISTAKGLPVEYSEQATAWKVELPGTGPSSPVFWKESIFLTGADPVKVGSRMVFALEAATGKLKWKKEFGFTPYKQHNHNNFASSSPAVDAERVYITWTDKTDRFALALDHAGKILWEKKIGPFFANHGSATSPVVFGDTLVLTNEQETDAGFVIGLDCKTGDERWRVKRLNGKAPYCTPISMPDENGSELAVFASVAHGVTAIDPASGEIVWESGPVFLMRTVGGLVVWDGKVFGTSGSGGSGKNAVLVDPSAKDGKANVVYELKKGLPYVVTPIAKDGLIYLWGDGGIVTCVDASDGETVWQNRVGGKYYASTVCIDGKLYNVSRDGELVVLATGREFKILGRSQLGERSDSTPTVHQGKLFLKTNSQLICLAPKKG